MSDELFVGDRVMIDSCEGFGGPGRIVAVRDVPSGRYRVRMDDDNPPEFWAHDFEVSPLEPEAGHDSRPDTRKHVSEVRRFLDRMIDDLERRKREHDRSKFESPEVEIFDEYTPRLAGCTYGSDEYRSLLAAMKPALDHHYAANSHHPEHYADGIRGMSLLDVVEMLCDWKAASLRGADGDVRRSVEINQERFGYSDDLKDVLLNTLPLLEQA